jgi:biopolymer transport protein ExbD
LRFTVGGLMLVIAMVGLWLAGARGRARRVAVVDLRAPNLIAVGDRPHTLATLQGYIRGSNPREAVIRSSTDVPYDHLFRVIQAVEAAGVHQVRITPAGSPVGTHLP